MQLLDEPQAPARPAAEVLVNMGGTRQRIDIAQWTRATEDVLPRRLGHSLLFTAQPGPMTDFYTQVLGLRVSNTVIAQIDVEYRRKDGKSVTVPNCDILVFDGDLVRDWQIYIDLAPVFS